MKEMQTALFLISFSLFITGCSNLYTSQITPEKPTLNAVSRSDAQPDLSRPSPPSAEAPVSDTPDDPDTPTNCINCLTQIQASVDSSPVDGEKSRRTSEACLFSDNEQIYENIDTAPPSKPSDTEKSESIQPIIDEALDLCQISQEFWQKGEPDNAIEALDNAYSLILKIDASDEPKITQQLDDLRFLISKRILEIYASRNTVVTGDYNEIPIIINDHVQREIDLFTQKGLRDFFTASYKRSGKYREMIVNELKESGLPVELSWLPLIESGFKVNALSPARALGLWQFIPSTGYKFGLKRTRYIDERMDPAKSTKAAIAYLKALHKIFGDWSTVLAAYNCGEWRVLKVIRSQNINYLDNFWDLYERLPRETARYVPKFMAVLHILQNIDKYDFGELNTCPPLKYETVNVSKQLHLDKIAKAIETPASILNELNAELRYDVIPSGGSYPLKVPAGKKEILLAKIDSIPKSSSSSRYYANGAITYHKIRKGETLSTIAERYGASVNRIMNANNIYRKHYIVTGRVIKVPLSRSYRHKSKSAAGNYKNVGTYVVKRGDSLWIIANRYGTRTKDIMALNHLRTTNLSIGQKLKIPGLGKDKDQKGTHIASSSKSGLRHYSVRNGDIPQRIASRYNMSLKRFLKINNLSPTSIIYPGQILYVD